MSRPTVGITSYWTQAAMSHWSCDAVLVSQGYVEGIRLAGGRPVVLPADTTWIDEPDDVLDIVDALLVVGGNDIDPTHYGQEPHASIGAISARRDAVELALVRRAVARDVPLLGICRGVQVLNVALGGTWVRAKVEEVFEEASVRRNPQEGFTKMHEDGNQENRVEI